LAAQFHAEISLCHPDFTCLSLVLALISHVLAVISLKKVNFTLTIWFHSDNSISLFLRKVHVDFTFGPDFTSKWIPEKKFDCALTLP
jgi:hypothetical protein